MDRDIEEYLSVRKTRVLAHSAEGEEDLLRDTTVDFHYERKISAYRSSTLMIRVPWGATHIISGEELHYEEFL